MKLQNYIKTDNIKTIMEFVKLCRENGIQISERIYEDLDNDIYGVGIFIDKPSIINDNLSELKATVHIIIEKPSSWCNKLSLTEYYNFIKTFNINTFERFLNEKFEETKKNFPQFQLGTEMIWIGDLKYGFFKQPDWEPYILTGYYYSEVNDKWSTITQKGYGDFEWFRVWDKKILSMNKKEIKNLIKSGV